MPPPPLFILCPGRSFSSIVCGVIGSHPEMFALPELNLFCADTVGELLEMASRPGKRNIRHGLLRTLAHLHGGDQTEPAIKEAKAWLAERAEWPTKEVCFYLAELISPRRCVDKSPRYARARNLRRLYEAFPDAQFLHLGRHPRSSGRSRFKAKYNKAVQGKMNPEVAKTENVEFSWVRAHEEALKFNMQLAPGQAMYLQGELLLCHPDAYLPQIAEWLGIDSGPEAIEAMKHPENSPFARFGPINAIGGNNGGYMQDPRLRIMKPVEISLQGPLEWEPDGRGFEESTIELARQLGYQ